jgi:hypothetical protein
MTAPFTIPLVARDHKRDDETHCHGSGPRRRGLDRSGEVESLEERLQAGRDQQRRPKLGYDNPPQPVCDASPARTYSYRLRALHCKAFRPMQASGLLSKGCHHGAERANPRRVPDHKCSSGGRGRLGQALKPYKRSVNRLTLAERPPRKRPEAALLAEIWRKKRMYDSQGLGAPSAVSPYAAMPKTGVVQYWSELITSPPFRVERELKMGIWVPGKMP